MSTALADGAWDKESASSRISGIAIVIGGWFVTALMAFIIAGITVSVLFFLKGYGLLILAIATVAIVYKMFHLHEKRTSGRKANA